MTAQVTVRVQPRARRDEIVGMRDGVLVARVTAPPVDGRANAAVCKLIAKRVGVAPSRVSLVRGEKSRDKVIRVEGLAPAALQAALSAGPPPPAAAPPERSPSTPRRAGRGGAGHRPS